MGHEREPDLGLEEPVVVQREQLLMSIWPEFLSSALPVRLCCAVVEYVRTVEFVPFLRLAIRRRERPCDRCVATGDLPLGALTCRCDFHRCDPGLGAESSVRPPPGRNDPSAAATTLSPFSRGAGLPWRREPAGSGSA